MSYNRSYYQDQATGALSLEVPADGINDEYRASDASDAAREPQLDWSKFDEVCATAEQTDNGLLNPKSKWVAVETPPLSTHAGKVCYHHSDSQAVTLKRPEEGIAITQQVSDAQFEELIDRAEKTDGGLLNSEVQTTRTHQILNLVATCDVNCASSPCFVCDDVCCLQM